MSRFRNLSHTIWHCQYHIVWTPMRKADLSTQTPVEVFRAHVAVFERPQPPIVDAEMRVMRESVVR